MFETGDQSAVIFIARYAAAAAACKFYDMGLNFSLCTHAHRMRLMGLLVLGAGNVSGQQPASLQPDPEIVNQLVGMGFSENGSKRAAVATQVPQTSTQSLPKCASYHRRHAL